MFPSSSRVPLLNDGADSVAAELPTPVLMPFTSFSTVSLSALGSHAGSHMTCRCFLSFWSVTVPQSFLVSVTLNFWRILVRRFIEQPSFGVCLLRLSLVSLRIPWGYIYMVHEYLWKRSTYSTQEMICPQVSYQECMHQKASTVTSLF